MILGTGIFMWDAPERRGQRYGYFYPADVTYNENFGVVPTFNLKEAMLLKGSKVKITVKVVEARTSSHVGDLYLGIFPIMPKVGEEVVLGVGILDVREVSANARQKQPYELGLQPDDGRKLYWIDPHQYYRLHDQTVEMYVEVTDEPHHPAPNIVPVKEAGKAISVGDGDIQIVTLDKMDWLEGTIVKIKPNIQRLGGGMFKLQMPNAEGNKGEQFDIEVEDE